MKGYGAHLRYTKGFNDLEGIIRPDFCSISDIVAHAVPLQELDKKWMSNTLQEFQTGFQIL